VRILWAWAGCFRWGWRASPTGARGAFSRAGVLRVSAASQAPAAYEAQAFSLRPPQTQTGCLAPKIALATRFVLHIYIRLMGVGRRGATTGALRGAPKCIQHTA
jgi:hypothetical protein